MIFKYIKRIYKFIVGNPHYFVITYFVLVAGLFAYSLNYAIVPDEGPHFTSIEYYSRFTPSPFIDVQDDAFESGDLTRLGSYLYYYFMGFIYNFAEGLGVNPLIPIRMTSVLFGGLTLLFLSKIGRLLNLEKKAATTILFLIANIPMFIVIAAGVNYDALVIVLAVITAYLMLLMSKKITLWRVLVLLIVVGIGPLVKFAFAPLSLVATVVLIYYLFSASSYRMPKKIPEQVINTFKGWRLWATLLLIVTLIGVIFLFTERYVVNYLEYGALNPKCDLVLTEDQCQNNFVYRRTKIYENANLEEPTVRLVSYLPQWYDLMISRTYGVLAHKSFNENAMIINIGLVLSLLLMIAFIRRYNFNKEGLYIVFSLLVYLTALVATNISGYKRSQEIGMAVQGRYLFPIAFPFIIYTVSLYAALFRKYRSNKLYSLVCIMILSFAVWAGPVNLTQGINESWIRKDKTIINTIFE